MQCPAGELAVRKAVTGSKKIGTNQSQTYYFDIEKCKQCPHREGCYKEGAKSRTFSVTLKCDEHKQQQEFQETEEFKQLSKERYKIEAKNSELKNVLGYDVSMGNCLYATKIQGACTIFAANIKRIITIYNFCKFFCYLTVSNICITENDVLKIARFEMKSVDVQRDNLFKAQRKN